MGQVAGGKRNYLGDFGVDAKYGLTTGLTWDFTYNTDFSQVEADEQQINLTRFSLFFPEKRDFFLENSGIFQFVATTDRSSTFGAGAGGRLNAIGGDMILFFSRRIGLSEDGDVIPILGGTRLTGRAGKYELGFLNIQQREFGRFSDTNFTVARVKRNILANSDIGVILLNKEVLDSSHFNRVAGADANFRFGRYLSINSFLAKSMTPANSGRDVTGRASISYKDNTWDLRGSYMSIQENFVDEMGFVPRVGIRKGASYLGRTFRPKRSEGVLRSLGPHIQYDYIVDRDGRLDTRYVDYHVPFYFQNGSFVEVGGNQTLERFSSPFLINRNKNISIPPGVYSSNEYFIVGRSDESRRLSGNFRLGLGDFYTGYRHLYTVGGAFRYNHKFNTSFSFTHNNINLPEGHFKTNLLGIRANYDFSTKMFLNAFIQYNNDTRQWSSNVRFNLINRPLSDFFLVYNERRDSISGDLINRAIIAKFTYMIAR